MHSEFLFIIAENAAAFAGFASLVAAISTRGGRSAEQEQLDPAPEPREPLQAIPTDPILSRRANPGLILPIH
jgi:hypothetical protein